MELVLPQADKMTHALKKLHILERCFRTGAEGKAAPSALHESKGIFSFAKENIPFGTPRERRLDWQSRTRMTFMPPEWKYLHAALPRLVLLYDLAYFYFRCRFACDSLPLRNFRLLQICTNLPLPAKAALLALAAIYALSVDGD